MKFFRDLLAFYAEVWRSRRGTGHRFTVDPNWWLTRNVDANEDRTGDRTTNACSFFWTAIIGYPSYRIVGNSELRRDIFLILSLILIVVGIVAAILHLPGWWVVTVSVSMIGASLLGAIIIHFLSLEEREIRLPVLAPCEWYDFPSWKDDLGRAKWYQKPFVVADGAVVAFCLGVIAVVTAVPWAIFKLLKKNFCPIIFRD